ncbi:MAG: hypothetical protein ACRDL5_12160 [Solirubrobacteraceae bacterium]
MSDQPRSCAGATAGYELLATLIERELQLAGERRFDELAGVSRERLALQDSLPQAPPREALELLERCARLHKRVEIELLRVREALLLELAQVGRAQRAATGYAPVRRSGRRIAASA